MNPQHVPTLRPGHELLGANSQAQTMPGLWLLWPASYLTGLRIAMGRPPMLQNEFGM